MDHLQPTPPEDQENIATHPSLESSAAGEESAGPEAQPGGEEAAGKRLTIVGIGASAGGLVALQGFFEALPANTGMAYAVVTHMDPDKESLLPELLQKYTDMPVAQVTGELPIEVDHVYVIAPGQRIHVTDSHFDVERFEEPRGLRMPIDHFYRSLAGAHGEAVAIILSGGGTDGAVGVKAIKEGGGLLMVQHPDEAEHDSMPRAAINTGLADVVLPVAQLAHKLVAYRQQGTRVPSDPGALTPEAVETVYRILTQVQTHTGHDFSQYKRSTILRRIQRRMQLHGFATLDAYLTYLRHEATEAHALFNDLLIGVTNFFRDQDSWEALGEQVIPRLFQGKTGGETVRVWSIGCATGEEAYSLGILLLEHAATLELPQAARPAIQVFASDLDDEALLQAREGVYPEAIEADVSPERLARFFVKEGHSYRARRELRDIVLFSNHSVLRDPPFSRLELISCRNLLIYLNRELQENVFQIFHYALNPGRYLFLGSSESAEMVHGLFRTTDKTHRIYQARPWRGEHRHIPALPLAVRGPRQRWRMPENIGRAHPLADSAAAAASSLHQAMLEESAPPSILVDEQHHVVHISETAGRYLQHPRGIVTADLLNLVRPELQYELRTALLQAFARKKMALTRSILVRFNGAPRRVVLAVRPVLGEGLRDDEQEQDPESERLALVLFLEDEAGEVVSGAEAQPGDGETRPARGEALPAGHRDTLLAQLEGEVQRLHERLQSTSADYDSSNEELKAANEELQSINEEYRTTTEELETSQEELQSVNEELQTVNAELKNKLEEISRAHSDLENLLVSTDIVTLFLDRELRIQRYTTTTAELFNIMPGDRGRPLDHLTHRLTYQNLAEDAAQVLQTLAPIEREVQDSAGRWLLARLRPYRSADDRIDGVMLTFVDITALKSAEEALRDEKEYSEKIVHTVREGMLVLDPGLQVEFANDSFLEMFDVDKQGTVGSLVYDLGDGQWNIPALRRLLEEILPQANIFNDFRVEQDFEKVGRRVMLLNARRLDHMERILLAIEDITEREQYEEDLRQLNEQLEARVKARTEEVRELAGQLTMAEHEERARIAQVLHDDLQQQLYGLQIQLEFLRAEASEALRQEIAGMEKFLIGAMDTARHLSVDLSPPILEGDGLGEALSWLGMQMQERYQLRVNVEVQGSLPQEQQDLRILLFQMVRELLFNIVKHADVSDAQVTVQAVEDAEIGEAYRIDVVDRGVGLDPELFLQPNSSINGRGLVHIRQRLRFIGGRVELASPAGGGTRVTILAPLHVRAGQERAEMEAEE